MTADTAQNQAPGAARPVNITRILLFTIALVIVPVIPLAWAESDLVTHTYFVRQDVWVIIGLCFLFFALSLRIPLWSLPRKMPPEKAVWTVAVLLMLALWAGTYLVMFDYPITRDELMAVFDQKIYSSFQLYLPLPAKWDGYALALVPAFLLNVPDHTLLVSFYTPGNAMARAAVSWIADPALLNPALAALGFVILYRIARKLFPETPEAVWIALLVYLLSAQVWVNAMTTYAMTGHLALDLVWLALFLRGSRLSHAGAMAIGFILIGWHQVLFHPLFAAPFILSLLAQRRWTLFLAYSGVYGASLLFWINYPHLVTYAGGIVAQTGSTSGASGYITERVLPRILNRNPRTISLMEFNLLRFIAWQALFMLPLLVLSYSSVRRGQGIAWPLAFGIILTLVAMLVIIPYQGDGWGYRYFHGLIGSFALLCGYGYRYWAESAKAQANGLTAVLGVATLVSLPFLLVTTHFLVKPHAQLAQLVQRQKTDFVVVNTDGPAIAIDQVRNAPDLSNRPLIFSSKDLDWSKLVELCRRGTVSLIGLEQLRAARLPLQRTQRSVRYDLQVMAFEGRPCLKPTVP